MKLSCFILACIFLLLFTESSTAQQLFARPKNQAQFAARIINEQKTWQQLQMPKNSVQYKINPPHIFTYTFKKNQTPFIVDIKLPGKVVYKTPYVVNQDHPYLKYYPSYSGKLKFNKLLF